MKRSIIMRTLCVVFVLSGAVFGQQDSASEYKLVWADEFNNDGVPDPCNWDYERGFVRNREYQWYQPDNARCEDGLLVIEGRRQRVKNPNYDPNSRDWKRNRQYAEYTSASLRTRGRREWTYGRFEMRGRIKTEPGLWPAFWTLGTARGWPGCGEIDIMEYYRGLVLANACWASGTRQRPIWDDFKKPIAEFGDPDWDSKFHIWRMDWDEHAIKLYLDGKLLNTIELSKTINQTPDGANPFREPHYIIVNLAIGGTSGGDPSTTRFPTRYEIDYIRVYQKRP